MTSPASQPRRWPDHFRALLTDHKRLLLSTLICVGVGLILGIYGLQPVWWSRLIQGMFLVVMLTLMVWRAKQETRSPDQILPLILEQFVAMVTGIVLAGSFAAQSSANASATVDLGSVLIPGLVAGSVLFLIQALSQSLSAMSDSHRRINELEKVVTDVRSTSDTLDKVAKNAEKAFAQGDYAALAANVLHLQRRDFERLSSEVDPIAPTTLECGIDILAAAAKTAYRLQLHGVEDSVSIKVWWKFLRTYFQEEMYDISNFEVATNVRNYAYAIISLARALQDELQSDQRLIVVNVSPFNPKDFYNWPNRSAEQCNYHEAEFFAVYRRAFSKLFRSEEKVLPLRIIVSASDDLRPPKAKEKRIDLGLGWSVDFSSHIVESLAYYRFCPFPVFRTITTSNRSIICDVFDEELSELADGYCSDSKIRLRGVADRVITTPFVNYHGDSLYAGDLPLALRSLGTENGGVELERRVAQLAATRGKNLEEYCHRSWLHALEVLKTTLLGQGNDDHKSEATSQLINRLASQLTNDLAQCRDNALSELEQRGFPRRYCRALFDAVISIAEHATSPFKAHKSNRIISDLLDWTQAADSKLRFLSTFGTSVSGDAGTRSCFGTEMGVFEEWSLFFCINAYFVGASESFSSTGLIPLWRLFFRDFLGVEARSNGAPTDERKIFDECLDRVNKRLRVFELSSHDGGSENSVAALRERGITSEFALFCIAPSQAGDDIDFTRVKPVLLLSTSLSEPFHTCKLKLKVPNSDGAVSGAPDAVTSHWDWVKTVFEKEGTITNARMEQVAKFVGPVRKP